MKIGIFGGTFNPIHFGHLRAAEEAREKASLDKVLFVPAGSPPLKSKSIATAEQRLQMASLATAGNSSFEVLDIECSRPGVSYTIETLQELQAAYKEAELFFLLGADAFLDIPNWWQPEQLISLVNFIVFTRPGADLAALAASPYVDGSGSVAARVCNSENTVMTLELKPGRKALLLETTPLSISSTDIRSRLQRGRSIKYLLPQEVESFIISNRLYLS